MQTLDRVTLVTGADSGLGRTVAESLSRTGRVVTAGIGPHVDVQADLTTRSGRMHLVAAVRDIVGDRLDAFVAVAGSGSPRPSTVSLNYFGVTEVTSMLYDVLAASSAPSVVVVSSSSTLNRGSGALVRAARSGDESRALAVAGWLAATGRGSKIYRSSKQALNHWVRTSAVERWAKRGITVNAVAPGIIATEALLETWDDDRALLEAALPQPLGAPGPVQPVADLICWMASERNRFMTGQVVYCDGGTDALTRGVRPLSVYLRYSARSLAHMVRVARRRARHEASQGATR